MMKTDSDLAPSSPDPARIAAEEMARYGIVRVPVDYFHVGGFRYTALADAIAQAKRDRAGS